MAGVGFELRKLFRTRTAAGHIRAYSYSAMITAGPFALMTGMVLAIQLLFHLYEVDATLSQIYLASVVYAFVFSQILTCGFTMVLTRYVADCLSLGRYEDVSASLFGMGALITAIGGTAAIIFYWGSPLEFATKFFAYLFFALLSLIWVQSVYLSAIKKFKRLLLSYVAGIALTIFLTFLFLEYGWAAPMDGALFSMSLGASVIVLLFFFHIIQHFGLPADGMNFAFLPHFERHWRLFAISYCYTLGVFIPNMLIWQGEWGVSVSGTYRFAPVYDVVTFYAFLSILPLMTMFVVSVETTFYERYVDYFTFITKKGNFREIDDARKDLLHTLWFELRHMIEYQLVFTLVFLALGNYILSGAGITYNQVNMYNVLLFAAFFTGVLQLIYILLIYFDCQEDVLQISGLFLVCNFVFGLIGLLWLGNTSYGFTFFLATGVSLFYGLTRLSRFGKCINYFVFCGQPVFYQPPNGILTRLAHRLYGDRLVDMERGDKE